MKRRTFIKTSALGGTLLGLYPLLAMNPSTPPLKELIGKGQPKLYGSDFKLRKDACEAFLKMKTTALKDGIAIQVVSSYRNFNHQNRIWTNKYNRYIAQGLSPEKAIEKIIEYSTIPGSSRHHWGTDIDIIDGNAPQPKTLLIENNYNRNGVFSKLKNWMDAHAESYGFYLVYTNTPKRKGFKYEPWHYSYKPLSQNYLKAFCKMDFYNLVKHESLAGHASITKSFVDAYIKQNILDINPELLGALKD